MKSFADNSTRLRRRRGVSQSGLRKIERLATQGPRAIRRQFVAAQRPASSPDHHSITISEGRTYARQ
jgi:hypothetical protein